MRNRQADTEAGWDRLLGIKTAGRDDSHSDQHCYPYEPTPYAVLERLCGSGLISRKNILLDARCGKGRVEFFISWQTGCRCYGVEFDERIFQSALSNRENAVSGSKTAFENARAEHCTIPEGADRFYFFNPFSVQILQAMLGRIMDSWYGTPREILLFFYYPSDEYVAFLMAEDSLVFEDEIDCRDLFGGKDGRERILVFKIGEGGGGAGL